MPDTPLNKKVLVIRFNAIGDLVLTTPTIKALADNSYEVHFLVKSAFASILTSNPNVSKVWLLKDSLSNLIEQLQKEAFDLVVDLHNNFRSKKVGMALSLPTYVLRKKRAGMWLLTNLGINKKQQEHIVNRFLKVIEPLGIKVDKPKTTYFLPNTIECKVDLPSKYLAIAVGAAWVTKEIPIQKLVFLIDNSKWKNIVLLGGPDDKAKANELLSVSSKSLINLVGKLSIDASAQVVNEATVLLTGDTGMMHIAAALGTDIIALFGSTHPLLGYTPHLDEDSYTIFENKELNCRPCTKQGKASCPKGHFRCMLDLDYKAIVQKIDTYI